MLCKYVLTVAGTMYELPKSCIRNWDEIKRTLKRDGFGGVIRTFTSKFEFVGSQFTKSIISTPMILLSIVSWISVPSIIRAIRYQ